jgi:predicted metalloprotease with PDZ domain
VRGVPHRIVIDGEGNYDPERMRADVKKIVEAEVAMFGGIPYHDYTFILHLRSNTGRRSGAFEFNRARVSPLQLCD